MAKNFFQKFIHQWKVLLKDSAYRWSLFIGLVVIIFAYMASSFISVQNDMKYSISVGDLLLDILPTLNMEFFYTWVMYLLTITIFIYPVFFKPEILPFTLKTFGLLVIVRSCFIALTHLGPPPGFYFDSMEASKSVFEGLRFRNDLFFSGHTAIPFLAFLLFKGSMIRYVMLAGSILMAVTVLLMHVHYSIDVFAAFFITHGTYTLSDNIFNRLNLRFKKMIKRHGFDSFHKKLEKLRLKQLDAAERFKQKYLKK